MKQYFVMRYRRKRGTWRVCCPKGQQLMNSFEAQRKLHVLAKKFPQELYKLGVQV